jgi:hypothetical protein
MRIFLTLLFAIIVNSNLHAQCSVEASYSYTVSDDSITFYNTTTGAFGDPIIYWNAGGAYFYEDPDSITFHNSYFDTTSNVCLYYNYYPDSVECNSISCLDIFIDGDTTGCSLDVQIDYVYEDGLIQFLNASTGVPDGASFQWSIGEIVIDEESPIVDVDDIDDLSSICLSIFNTDSTCYDSTCFIIELAEDTVDCSTTELSFIHYVIGDSVALVNTSTGIQPGADFTWQFGLYTTYDEPDDVITVPLALLDSTFYTWLRVDYDDPACSQSLAAILDLDLDADPCVGGTYMFNNTVGDSVYFYGNSYIEPDDAIYEWEVAGESYFGTELVIHGDELGEYEEICLTISDPFDICTETICDIYYFGDDSTYCEDTDASFYYVVEDDSVTFINTSIGVMPDATSYWLINDLKFYEPIDEITFAVEDLEEEGEVWLKHHYLYPVLPTCNDSTSLTLYLDTDTTIATMIVDFDFDLTVDELVLVDVSTDIVESPAYYWTVGDLTSSDVNPVFPLMSLADEEEVCLTITSTVTDAEATTCELLSLTDAGLNHADQSSFSVYPNPASNEIRISLKKPTSANSIEIYNLAGERMAIVQLNGDAISFVDVDISRLESGTYMIRLFTNDSVVSQQQLLIKQ